jgi:tetratricopeptide (TPR) repeat protein
VSPEQVAVFPFPVERERRLSESLLWQAQRKYFHREGVGAWRTNTVPHYITNNPALARAYADVVYGFLRDCESSGRGSDGSECQSLDTKQTLYILELGAGSGRFGFFFLRVLAGLMRQRFLGNWKVRYILSDFTDSNLHFWRSQEDLQPFFEQGILDLAVFDAGSDIDIRLERTGETLSAGDLQNPLVVLANYVFDSIPQDAFTFNNGQISECLISLFSDRPEPDWEDPEVFQRLASTYSHRPASADYYSEPTFNEILCDYGRKLDEATILFPRAALQAIEMLARIANGRLLLLTADKGEVEEASLTGAVSPGMILHGSFSMQVNYHAISEYFRKSGGQVLKTPHRHANLLISGGLLGKHPTEYRETRLAFHQAVERWSPDDFYTLRLGIQAYYDKMDIPQLLSLIRISGYDPRIFRDCLPALWPLLEEAPEAMKLELRHCVRQTWENYYHLAEPYDLLFDLGLLLHKAGDYLESLKLFQESRRIYGDDPRTLWNLGLCHAAVNQPEKAVEYLRMALADGSCFSPSGALQLKS